MFEQDRPNPMIDDTGPFQPNDFNQDYDINSPISIVESPSSNPNESFSPELINATDHFDFTELYNQFQSSILTNNQQDSQFQSSIPMNNQQDNRFQSSVPTNNETGITEIVLENWGKEFEALMSKNDEQDSQSQSSIPMNNPRSNNLSTRKNKFPKRKILPANASKAPKDSKLSKACDLKNRLYSTFTLTKKSKKEYVNQVHNTLLVPHFEFKKFTPSQNREKVELNQILQKNKEIYQILLKIIKKPKLQ